MRACAPVSDVVADRDSGVHSGANPAAISDTGSGAGSAAGAATASEVGAD